MINIALKPFPTLSPKRTPSPCEGFSKQAMPLNKNIWFSQRFCQLQILRKANLHRISAFVGKIRIRSLGCLSPPMIG